MGPMCQRIVTTEPLEIKASEDAMIPAGLTSNGRHVGFGIIKGNHRNNTAEGLILGRTLLDLEDHFLSVRVCDVMNLMYSILSCQLEVRTGFFISSMLYLLIFEWTVVLTAN